MFYNYTILHYSQTGAEEQPEAAGFYNYTILHYSQTGISPSFAQS